MAYKLTDHAKKRKGRLLLQGRPATLNVGRTLRHPAKNWNLHTAEHDQAVLEEIFKYTGKEKSQWVEKVEAKASSPTPAASSSSSSKK